MAENKYPFSAMGIVWGCLYHDNIGISKTWKFTMYN